MRHKKSDTLSVVAIGDAHNDGHIPQDRFTWIGRFIAARKPDHVVQIGDLLTLDSLNTHIPNETFSGRLKGTYLDDMVSGNNALKLISKEIKRLPIKKHLTDGNHERRLYLLEESVPEVAGLMQLEYERILASNGWTHSPYGEIYKIGGVGFVHAAINRLGKTFGGLNAETQIANHSTMDLVLGHSHVLKIHTAPKVGGDFVRVINLGCALPQGHVESYARHSQTGWSWGVWHLTIWDNHLQDFEFISMQTLEKLYA